MPSVLIYDLTESPQQQGKIVFLVFSLTNGEIVAIEKITWLQRKAF